MRDLSRTKIVVSVVCVIGLAALAACWRAETQTSIDSNLLEPNQDWLMLAESDAERFRLIQTQLRGFDQPMWEVGERYRIFHEAIENENYELAKYHWRKIGVAIRNGIAKRPARVANADALFLNSIHGEVAELLSAEDQAKAHQAFSLARAACVSCHQAEGVDWINRQQLMKLSLE